MKTRSKIYKNDWFVMMEKTELCGLYRVIVRAASGELHDKILCDDYREACEYYKAFQAIAAAA